MKKLSAILCCSFFFWQIVRSQVTFPVNGPKEPKEYFTVFKNAVLHMSPGSTVNNGMLIIRQEKIIYAGPAKEIPEGSVVYDLQGYHIYPSFIDPYSQWGMPEVKKEDKPRFYPQMISDKKGPYNWNEAVKPETHAVEIFVAEEKTAESLRKYGFGSVVTHQQDGIIRGTSAFVLLGERPENKLIVNPHASLHFSFKKGSSSQDYPSSQMGSIALIRQTLYDAQWYKNTNDIKEYNYSLDQLNRYLHLPTVFEADNKWEIFRSEKIAKEFSLNAIYCGSGDEYQRLKELKKLGVKLILPLNFPEPFKINDPYELDKVDLADLKHWELAPFNPALLESYGIEFAFTLHKLVKKDDFLKNLRKAVNSGLSDSAALAALTTVPAKWFGAGDKLGTLTPGKLANFIISDENIFEKDAKIYENWVGGKRFVIEPRPENAYLAGEYRFNLNEQQHAGELKFENNQWSGKWYWISKNKDERGVVKVDTIKIDFKPDITADRISFMLKHDSLIKGVALLTAVIRMDGKIWEGQARLPDGKVTPWSAIKQKSFPANDSAKVSKKQINKDSLFSQLPSINFPLGNYGYDSLPQMRDFIIKGATIWTCEDSLPLSNADILVQNGKIVKIGFNLPVEENIWVIDGKGKHVTPGIIDEHSHIAISKGVNEGTQSSSAEVRIGDVINPDDINIYRQLAGGVVAAQLLHGSANPIGGQSAIIKLKWGKMPDEMKIEDAPGFIKFALGENVKQSNWGDFQTVRYPQTRMGVEQTFYEYFTRAKEYMRAKEQLSRHKKALSNKKKKNGLEIDVPAFRVDLELEAIAEILQGKRFITCHSYVQSEINMLMHVADSMGFKVNTFTHVLEGYKVADKLKKHGAGASTFSDWWAYKFEVNDAIPYNAALLTRMGVVTAINSDDAEMAGRLNQEAAKTIKYGNLTEMEALKTITLNPAKLLHIDHRTGSIKPGKDADLVIWSGHPLSVYSVVEKTFIEGVLYYDSNQEVMMKQRDDKEKMRILKKMQQSEDYQKAAPYQPKKKILYHCESMEIE